MRIPKSCELWVIQDFVEYLMTYNIPENYIWFEKGFLKKIFLRLCFHLYLLFALKKEFWSKKVFGKEFYTDKIKEGKPT